MLNFMVEKLCSRIEKCRKLGQPMPMREAYMCLATDVITLYALNHSWNLLDSPDFSPFWLETLQAAESAGHFLRHFPFMLSVFQALPPKVIALMNPGMVMLLQLQKVSLGQPPTNRSEHIV
jgi:hypothetical protein